MKTFSMHDRDVLLSRMNTRSLGETEITITLTLSSADFEEVKSDADIVVSAIELQLQKLDYMED